MSYYPERLDEIEQDIFKYCPECKRNTPHKLTYGFWGEYHEYLRYTGPYPAFYVYCECCDKISATILPNIRAAKNHDNRPLELNWD